MFTYIHNVEGKRVNVSSVELNLNFKIYTMIFKRAREKIVVDTNVKK